MAVRHYRAHETERMQELDGLPLATFNRRAVAFLLDAFIALVLLGLVVLTWALLFQSEGMGGKRVIAVKVGSTAGTIIFNIIVPVVYFGLLTWWWDGRTIGKRLMRIRVLSLVHEHMTLWHSLERALGYGAAALECGFGFLQYFIHPNRRCVQDRIAETIVVDEWAYQQRQVLRKTGAATAPATEPQAVEQASA